MQGAGFPGRTRMQLDCGLRLKSKLTGAFNLRDKTARSRRWCVVHLCLDDGFFEEYGSGCFGGRAAGADVSGEPAID
jgi:hypothetical protein